MLHIHNWIYTDDTYVCKTCEIAVQKKELLENIREDELYHACLDRLASDKIYYRIRGKDGKSNVNKD